MTQPPTHDPYGQSGYPQHSHPVSAPGGGHPGYPQHSQPVSAPGGGHEQIPGYTPPPGYPTQGYSPHTPPPPPPKRFTGPMIGLVSLAVVAAIGIVTLLVVNLSGDDPQTTASSSPSVSEEPTSEEPTTEPTIEETTQSGSGDRVSEAEFDDWDFLYEGTDLFAAKIGGWDHEDCSETDATGILTDYGCEWATEVAYEAEDGDVLLSVIYLGLPDDASASDLASDISDSDFILNDESYIHDWEFGRWISEASGPYVVLTTGTATDAVDDEVAQEYLDNLHWDVTLALAFRF